MLKPNRIIMVDAHGSNGGVLGGGGGRLEPAPALTTVSNYEVLGPIWTSRCYTD